MKRPTFGLGALLVGFTVIAIICGLIGVRLQRARWQRGLIEKLQADDAVVYYNEFVGKMGPWLFENQGVPPEDTVWKRWLGIDFFHSIGGIRYYSRDSKDQDLAYLQSLPDLRALSVRGPHITDRGVEQLTALTNLQLLELSGAQLTDASAPLIGDMRNLVGLNLCSTKISDRTLTFVSRLDQLETLMLSYTAVSDNALVYIARLRSLKELHLDHTKVSDRKLPKLAHLRDLRLLTLSASEITDGKGIVDLVRESSKVEIAVLTDAHDVSPLPVALQEQSRSVHFLRWDGGRWAESMPR